MGWTTEAIDEDHCVATWDRLLIQIWRLEAPVDAVTRLHRIARAFMADRSRRVSSLAIIEPTATPPSQSARAALSKFYREIAPDVGMAIVVPEGGGFRAAFVRGVGITLSTLAPRTLPFKFVGTVADASVLLGPHLSPAGDTRTLLDQIAGIRRELSDWVQARARP
jgi:hypothetical protein